jgi:hypothetical protein
VRVNTSIADQLRASIRSCGKSEYAVAKAAQVDTGLLSRFMRDERGISLATVERLCRELNLVLADAKPARKPARRGR